MSIVGAFDVHRRQLTFEYLDAVTGELKRGRVAPADREHLREWLARLPGQDGAHFALEGCTGWRYVVEELLAAGIEPHLAEPADTAALRGRKRHAKTDKTDARHLRVHLLAGDLPECWIPPAHVLEARGTVRLYKDLLDERGAWHQRIAATLFHQGVPVTASMSTVEGRAAVSDVRRFASSSDVVRHTGLDITVYSSDGKRSAGHLSRQGPQLLRWALYESAKCAARPAAPDYGYYTATRDRRTGGLATLSVARKLARRCYHTLRELGEEALAPAA